MSAYAGLKFTYAEAKRDLELMGELAEPFLDNDGKRVINDCAIDLENVRCTRETAKWQIRTSSPVRTRASVGAYRASGKGGGTAVYGELCFTWSLVNPDAGRRRQNDFILFGLASTSIKIKVVDTGELVAQWQFEAGDSESPGCHFHSAVNQYGDEGVFPEWLKIPRFPGLFLAPMDGLEFLLGELFQLEWLEHVSRDSYERNTWATSQKRRMEQVLRWQLSHVGKNETTPWMSLKTAKPGVNLLGGI